MRQKREKGRINAKKIAKKRKIVETCFPERPNFSIVQAVDQLRLCHDENSSEDVRTLQHRTNTNGICPSCGEFSRSRELWYKYFK
jgi:hypothetical protein